MASKNGTTISNLPKDPALRGDTSTLWRDKTPSFRRLESQFTRNARQNSYIGMGFFETKAYYSGGLKQNFTFQ